MFGPLKCEIELHCNGPPDSWILPKQLIFRVYFMYMYSYETRMWLVRRAYEHFELVFTLTAGTVALLYS